MTQAGSTRRRHGQIFWGNVGAGRCWRDLLLLGILTAGCMPADSAPPGAEDPAAPATPALELDYAGCRTVLPGPVCVLGNDRRLRLWVPDAFEKGLEITAGGQTWTAGAGRPLSRGLRFDLEVPHGASELAVRTASREEAWILRLTEPGRPDWEVEALTLFYEGRGDAARQLLRARLESPLVEERGVAGSLLARMSPGGASRAAELLAPAIQAHRASGRIVEELKDVEMLFVLHLEGGRFVEARELLENLAVPPRAPAEAAYRLAHCRGLMAHVLGDYRAAFVYLDGAIRRADRVGLVVERQTSEQLTGLLLQTLGRSREAAEVFARLAAEPLLEAPCNQASLLNNRAWSLLLAREAGESVPDPSSSLEKALEIYSNTCSRPGERVNVLLNLALDHLQSRRSGEARGVLARARELASEATDRQRLWWLDIEARLALSAGDAGEALMLYGRLEELAASALSAGGRWRALVGRARARRALGERAAALEAFGEAEALLDEQSLLVPLHEGRETFVAQREAGTRDYLDLLLETQDLDRALDVARRSRSRVLRGLRRDDRLAGLSDGERRRWYRLVAEYRSRRAELEAEAAGDWQLSLDQLRRARRQRAESYDDLRRLLDRAFATLGQDAARLVTELPQPAAGELVLLYHPAAEGWVGFAHEAGRLAVRRFDLPQGDLAPAEWSARLLGPFGDAVGRAARIRVLPYGRLRDVDFHALPWHGDVLLAAVPVVYGLDLEAPPAAAGQEGLQALIVADPRGDLPAARREARSVRDALLALSGAWSVRTLEGRSAGADALRSQLATVDLLHYAGHAVFAGRGGWQSALRLAGPSRLGAGDILTLERAPRWVVLSGCETARSDAAPVESLSLAHAFLVAGARQVVAATRPLEDRSAAALFSALYARWNPEEDFARQLRRALLAWRQEVPAADWASFRLLEP